MAPNRPDTAQFADDGTIPNSELPIVIYRRVDEVAGDAAGCEVLFERNRWWRFLRDGIYSFHHFHSTAHEALGVVAGRAEVVLGGPVNGERFELGAGDVAILPAGRGTATRVERRLPRRRRVSRRAKLGSAAGGSVRAR